MPINKKSMSFFKNMASHVNSSQCVKLSKNTDYTNIDADFILKYSNNKTNILDLGSGTGLIINKIYKNVGHITCIEPFNQFSDFIIRSSNIQIINTTIQVLIQKKIRFNNYIWHYALF